jgi:hypothetical protein
MSKYTFSRDPYNSPRRVLDSPFSVGTQTNFRIGTVIPDSGGKIYVVLHYLEKRLEPTINSKWTHYITPPMLYCTEFVYICRKGGGRKLKNTFVIFVDKRWKWENQVLKLKNYLFCCFIAKKYTQKWNIYS